MLTHHPIEVAGLAPGDAYALRGHISTNDAALERAGRVHLCLEDSGPLV